VTLPLNGAAYGNASSIFVSGKDVYVAGTTAQGAVLWNNGVATLLAAGGNATRWSFNKLSHHLPGERAARGCRERP
jgi:hypothetical protein